MSPKQTALYFREWGRVRQACAKHDLPVPERHELHIRALGRDKSSKDFTNEDLDLVLAEFRAFSRPADLVTQLRQQSMPSRRLVWAIQHLADEPYWRAIARSKFGTDDLDQLSLNYLTQLRNTLSARKRAKLRKPMAAAQAA